MDWDKLRIFHAVAKAGSFTHAGDVLNSSQSAISRQISSLEDSLGITLFHRHARGLLLTEQGELLYKTTKDIFSKLAMIEGQLSDSKQLPEGPLRITVAEFIGSTWLAPRLVQLRNAHPGIQLTILLEDRISNLAMREADAAIRLHTPEQPDLIQRHLTSIQFHICASKDYLDKFGKPSIAKDLKSHTLIGYPENITVPFPDPNWLLKLADIDPSQHQNLIMINSLFGIFKAVENGAGIAALPDYLVNQTDKIDTLFNDFQCPKVEMYFVYPEERRHSKRIAIFRDFLLDNIKQTNF